MDLVEGAFSKHELSAPGRNRQVDNVLRVQTAWALLVLVPAVSLLGTALAPMARSEHGSGMSFTLLSLTHLGVSRARACL